MTRYPIKLLKDEYRQPFFPFNTLESVLINGTNRTLADVLEEKITCYSTMPTPNEDLLGKIVQYTGLSDASYTRGYFYRCVSDGALEPTYSWSNISVQFQPTKTSDLNNDSDFINHNANNLTYYTLGTETGSTIELAINTTTYVMTLSLKNKAGTTISTSTIDFPLESVVVNATYDSTNKKIVLTLQNSTTVDVPIGDLVSGLQNEITAQNKLSADLVDDTNTTNKFVTASDKTTWGNKYDKPSGGIPSTDLASAVQTSLGKADTAVQDVSGKEDVTNKVSSITSSSTNTEYAGAKAVWDLLSNVSGLNLTVVSYPSTQNNAFDFRGKKKGIYNFNFYSQTGETYIPFWYYLTSAVRLYTMPMFIMILKDLPETINISTDFDTDEVFAVMFEIYGDLIQWRYFKRYGSNDSVEQKIIYIGQTLLTTSNSTQVLYGTKQFNKVPVLNSAPTVSNHITNKQYVDNQDTTVVNNMASAYDPTAVYSEGAYVIRDNTLYVCNTAITIPEAWTAAHWTQTNVASIIGNLNSVLATLTTPSNGGGS